MMEKIPSLDMKDIEDTVRNYTQGELKHVHNGMAHINGVDTTSAEEYAAAYTKNDRPVTHEEIVQTMTVLLESGYLDKDSQKLAKLLIDNPRYSRKMVLVYDGSYRNNRIWITHGMNLSIDCHTSYNYREYVDFTGKSVKYQLNWMWNHYDVIYFQVPIYKSVGDVVEESKWNNRWLDLIDDYCLYDGGI